MTEIKSFHDVVRSRRSARSFLPDPVSQDIILSVLDDARRAPSNSNVQPWVVHIVSGDARDRLSRALIEAATAEKFTFDFPFSYDGLYGPYKDRQQAQGAGYFTAAGIGREEIEQRNYAIMKNLEFFGAPHVCLMFMAPVYDEARLAGDLGMFGQTFLLSLTAHNLSGCPQTLLSLFADTIRESLDIDPAYKMLFGISFGHAEPDNPVNLYPLDKAGVSEFATFHQ
jgi:nitroreductase